MRTSFHHQPEAQHPNFPLSTSGQADYPIFRVTIRARPRRFPLVVARIRDDVCSEMCDIFRRALPG